MALHYFKEFTMLNWHLSPGSLQKLSLLDYIFLATLLWLAFYLGCASYAILDMNEGLYAEIAREMLEQRQYLIPHLNYVPYLEKPPLLYWLIALSYQLFGISEFAARFVPSTCAVLACLSLVWFGKRLGQPRAGWLAAVILASSFGFILIGRTVFFDMLLVLCLWLSLWCFYLWYQTDKRSYLRVAYAGLAGGLLTKGLVALVFPASIVVVFLLTEPCGWRKRLQIFDGWRLLLFFIIATPWHLLASLKQPHFAWDYFINEQFYRFLDKRIPNDYHTGPIYFYLPFILAYLFPWCLLLPVLRTISLKDPLQKFLGLGFLLPLIFYSISKAKGDYYMVVGVPPLALLLALFLTRQLEKGKILAVKWIFLGLAGLALVLLALLYYVNWLSLPQFSLLNPLKLSTELKQSIGWLMVVSGGYLTLASLACLTKRGLLLPVFGLAGFSVLMVNIYIYTRQIQQNSYSQKHVAQYLLAHADKQPVYLYQDFERLSSVLFYFRERLAIIDSQSQDLYFGSHTPAAKDWFITGDDFLQQAKQQPQYIVMRSDRLTDFNQLMAKRLTVTPVFLSKRAIIVKVQA